MTLWTVGVSATHLAAGFVGCEHPLDASAGRVSLPLPCADLAIEFLWMVDSTVEALAAQHPDLDLDHVEPAGVLGGVVELEAAQDAPGFGRIESLVEGAGRVARQVVLDDPDRVGVWIVNIDEFAHALGVILGGAPLGDLDLAPRPIGVEKDKEIDGAVTAILVIVSFKLAWRGRDGLAHLADQLDRALVEADHRPLGIRCFGVKVEHVFHAGDIFAIDPGDAPHVLAPGLEVVFGQSPANRLRRQALVVGELDHLASQQLQCPAGAPRRRLGAGGCHQKGFLLAGELALRSRTWLFGERPFEIALHEAPLGAIDGRASHHHGASNLLIAAADIGGQQDLGSLELAGGMLACAQHRSELIAFGLAQLDPITYIHLGLLVGSPDESTDESKIGRVPPLQPATFHGKVIYVYSHMFQRPPAETDMQRYFRVSPPSVHQMVLTLERVGLIRRQPGVARSIELLVSPEELPILKWLKINQSNPL